MIHISDFQTKDVVNIIDGRNLGQISDLELDLRTGRIEAIVVPGPSKFFGFFSNGNDLVIPWKNIVKIGTDVVLVKHQGDRYAVTSEGSAERPTSERPSSDEWYPR
jgi:YlmC/YmxH family sporulation protein